MAIDPRNGEQTLLAQLNPGLDNCTFVDGRLFVARMLKGTLVILDAAGRQEREIALTAAEPSNLAFGGPDGRTVYVTQRKGGYIESFMTDRPGREFCLQADRCMALAGERR